MSSQHALVRLVAAPLQGLGGGEGHGQDVGEAAVGGLHRADGLDVAGEAVPGVGVVQGVGDGVGVGVHAVGEDGVDQLLLRGEVAEEGGDPDPGLTGDGGHRGAQPVAPEHLAGGGDDPLPVALGVAAQGLGRGGGPAVGGARRQGSCRPV